MAGTRDHPYAVWGVTTQGVYSAIRSKGPMIGGQHVAAATSYRFEPEVYTRTVWSRDLDGSCTCIQLVREAEVSLDLTVMFPDWQGTIHTSNDCLEAWRTWITRLKRHEERHVMVARAARKEWESELEALEVTATSKECTRACATALTTLADAVEEINSSNDTRHRSMQATIDESEIGIPRKCSNDGPRNPLTEKESANPQLTYDPVQVIKPPPPGQR